MKAILLPRLKALKNDKRYIFKAVSAASKAHSYLMDKL